jgi:hypothetical protein
LEHCVTCEEKCSDVTNDTKFHQNLDTTLEFTNSIGNLSFEPSFELKVLNLTKHLNVVTEERAEGSQWESFTEQHNESKLNNELHVVVDNFGIIFLQSVISQGLVFSNRLFFLLKCALSVLLDLFVFDSKVRCIEPNAIFVLVFDLVNLWLDGQQWLQVLHNVKTNLFAGHLRKDHGEEILVLSRVECHKQ